MEDPWTMHPPWVLHGSSMDHLGTNRGIQENVHSETRPGFGNCRGFGNFGGFRNCRFRSMRKLPQIRKLLWLTRFGNSRRFAIRKLCHVTGFGTHPHEETLPCHVIGALTPRNQPPRTSKSMLGEHDEEEKGEEQEDEELEQDEEEEQEEENEQD